MSEFNNDGKIYTDENFDDRMHQIEEIDEEFERQQSEWKQKQKDLSSK